MNKPVNEDHPLVNASNFSLVKELGDPETGYEPRINDAGYDGDWSVDIVACAGKYWIIAPGTERFIDLPFGTPEEAEVWFKVMVAGGVPVTQFRSARYDFRYKE